jgi:hypothetical protein
MQTQPSDITIQAPVKDNSVEMKYKGKVPIALGLTLIGILFIVTLTTKVTFFWSLPIMVFTALIVIAQSVNTIKGTQTVTLNQQGIKIQGKSFLSKFESYVEWDMIKPLISKVEYYSQYKGVVIFLNKQKIYGLVQRETFDPFMYTMNNLSIEHAAQQDQIFIPVTSDQQGQEVVDYVNSRPMPSESQVKESERRQDQSFEETEREIFGLFFKWVVVFIVASIVIMIIVKALGGTWGGKSAKPVGSETPLGETVQEKPSETTNQTITQTVSCLNPNGPAEYKYEISLIAPATSQATATPCKLDLATEGTLFTVEIMHDAGLYVVQDQTSLPEVTTVDTPSLNVQYLEGYPNRKIKRLTMSTKPSTHRYTSYFVLGAENCTQAKGAGEILACGIPGITLADGAIDVYCVTDNAGNSTECDRLISTLQVVQTEVKPLDY